VPFQNFLFLFNLFLLLSLSSLDILHSILNIRIFSICILFPCFSTMFSSSGVRPMNSPICYEFGKIQRWTSPCTARIFSRISPHTILRVVAGTLTTFKIITCHLKLCLEKAMSQACKKKLLALGVHTFG